MFSLDSRARRAIVALLAVTATSFVVSGPATAQLAQRTDEQADLWTTDFKYYNTTGPDDLGGTGDIETASIRHRKYAVKLRMSFAHLSPYGPYMHAETTGMRVWAVIRTNEGVRRNLTFGWSQEMNDYEQVFVSAPSASLTSGRGGKVACDMTAEMDWGAGTVYVRIPRSCLSWPRWVKVAAGSERTNFYNSTWDDALSATSPVEFNDDYTVVHRETWTRRLFRG